MIKLALDAFFRQELRDSRAWGERALDVATALGDRPLTAAALAAVGLACAFAEAIADAELHCSRGGGADRRDARRGARHPPRRDRLPHRRRGLPRSVRGGDRTRPARSQPRARDRTGRAPADAHTGARRRALRARPARRGSRAAGRRDRGRAALGQPPDARLGPPEPRVRRGATRARWTRRSQRPRRASS